MEIRRRDFLKVFGGVSGAVLVGGCSLEDVFKLPEAMVRKAERGPGIESWKNSVCTLCPGGCGISVRLVDGIPVYVKGNPLHPVNQGGMCPLGLNSLHNLYHPDRITGPIRRIGKPGSGKWEPISWDEAMSLVANELIRLRKEGKSHHVAFLGHNERGLMRDHIRRFMQAYGSPNYYRYPPPADEATPLSLMVGHSRPPAFDFLNARLIVSFGANFLEEGNSPVYFTKIYSHHQDRQTTYIQIESRISLTAANADRWIPIRPGTYGALALGMAYVIIREELYDEDFVRKHTFGFDDWIDRNGGKHSGFKSFVLGNYYPDLVSDITGIPSSTILELARELGSTRPSVVVSDRGAIDNTNGTFSTMAVHALNALLGNIDQAGGVYFVDEPPFASLPEVSQDSVAKNGGQQTRLGGARDGTFPLASFSIDSFAKNVLADQPYPLEMLFQYGGNPLFESLNRHDLAEALKKIPFIVSFDSVINETSEYAALILPDHTFMEKWEEVSNTPSVGFSHLSIQQPVVEPLYDTRHTANVLMGLAGNIGGSVAAAYPFSSYQDVLKHRVEGVYKSGEGAVVSAGVRRSWIEYLQQRGWQVGRYASFEEFWNLLLERGGWWNPIRASSNRNELFTTPSGKFEFYSQVLKKSIDRLIDERGRDNLPVSTDLVLNRLNISARGDSVYFPHHEAVPYEPDMPLHLVTFRILSNSDGQGSNLPIIMEIFGHRTHTYWTTWAEIHPDIAAQRGIRDEDWIWVESSVGSIKVRAKVTEAVMPGVVAVPFGLGHTSNGRYAAGHGANPNVIMKNLHDLLTGRPALEATKVKVSRST